MKKIIFFLIFGNFYLNAMISSSDWFHHHMQALARSFFGSCLRKSTHKKRKKPKKAKKVNPFFDQLWRAKRKGTIKSLLKAKNQEGKTIRQVALDAGLTHNVLQWMIKSSKKK